MCWLRKYAERARKPRQRLRERRASQSLLLSAERLILPTCEINLTGLYFWTSLQYCDLKDEIMKSMQDILARSWQILTD